MASKYVSPAQLRYRAAAPHPRVRVQLRAELRLRDGDDCWICGRVMDFTDAALATNHDDAVSLEHVTEFRSGGGWVLENLRLTHRACNQLRSNSANNVRMGFRRVEVKAIPMPGWPADPILFEVKL